MITSQVQAIRLPVETRDIVWGIEVWDERSFASVNLDSDGMHDLNRPDIVGTNRLSTVMPGCGATVHRWPIDGTELSKALGLPLPRCMFFRTCM